ncbi:MAG: DUF6153 family protein, partial [Nocardioides sp.]
FAMHGLAAHGAMHSPASGDQSMAAMAVGSSHGKQPASVAGVAQREAGSTSGHEAPGGDESMLMALCLALLAAALMGLLGLRGREPVAYLLARDRAQSAPRPVARRDRDPPCLHALSIQRC